MPLLPTVNKTYYWISGTLFILVALKVLLYSDGYALFLGLEAGTFKTVKFKSTDYKSRLKAGVENEDQIFLMVREIQQKMMIMNTSIQVYNISCNETSIDGTEDLLCKDPPRFLQSYKNPCWYSRTGRFKCLPYFQLIGAGKCASSDLFARIIKHPDAFGNSGTRHKETFWWSWYRYGIRMDTLKRSKKLTFEDYLHYFRSSAKIIEKNPGRGYITGDGSPMDLSDNCGWPNIPQNNRLKDPKFTTAHLIRHVNPDVKLLVILREPVNRSFSDYIFRGTGPKTPEGFHHAVVTSIKILHTCTRNASLRACLYDRKLHFRSPARLHMGFYFVFLQDWFQVFPREQFHIIRTEDYSRDMRTYLKETYRFLGLRDLSPSDMDEIVKSVKKWVTHRKEQAGEMYTETRKILEELYGTFNEQLARLLQDHSFTWR